MAHKVTTEYTCDGCGKRVKESRDLRRFKLEQVKRGRGNGEIVHADLCGACEAGLLAAVEPFFAAEGLPELHGMSRVDAA